MEFITEQFNIDMRKVDLYSKNAYMEYEFACEEAFLESPDDVEYIITEAGENLLEKIGNAFKKIIETIRKFFTNLIEKVKSVFTTDKEEKIKRALQDNPELAKVKVEVPNLKEIEDVCGKRAILRKKMITEYNRGTLTRDKFNQMLEQSEKLGKRLKTVGVVTATIGTIAAVGFGASKIIDKIKNKQNQVENDVTGLQNESIKRMRTTLKQKGIKSSQLKLGENKYSLQNKAFKKSNTTTSTNPKTEPDKKEKSKATLTSQVNDTTITQTPETTKEEVSGNEVAQAVSKIDIEFERAHIECEIARCDEVCSAIADSRKRLWDKYDKKDNELRELKREKRGLTRYNSRRYDGDLRDGVNETIAKTKYSVAKADIDDKYNPLIAKKEKEKEHTGKLIDKRNDQYDKAVKRRIELADKLDKLNES